MNVQATGGKVHEAHPCIERAFPWCRDGSQDRGRTQYGNTDAPVDCARCLEQSRRRAIREANDSAANTAHAPEAPQPAAPEDARVLDITDDLKDLTAHAILCALAVGMPPGRVVRRVTRDILCEAQAMGCTPAQRQQVIRFVVAVGADLFVTAGEAMAQDEQARAQDLCGNDAVHGLFSCG